VFHANCWQDSLDHRASGGIGYELSKLFAADGYGLVLVARSQDKLDQAAAELSQGYGVNVLPLAVDLGDPAASEEINAALQARSITVDVLVNNAGFGVHGPFAQSDLAEELSSAAGERVALTRLTKLLLPGMVERGWGRVLTWARPALSPRPLMAAYGPARPTSCRFRGAWGGAARDGRQRDRALPRRDTHRLQARAG